jgi:hypothetical protein
LGEGTPFLVVYCIFINKFCKSFGGRVHFYPPPTSHPVCIYERDGHANGKTDRREGKTDKNELRNKQTDGQKEMQINRYTHKRINEQTDGEMDRDEQTDGQDNQKIFLKNIFEKYSRKNEG